MEPFLRFLEKVGVPSLLCATCYLVIRALRYIVEVSDIYRKWKSIPDKPLSEERFKEWIEKTYAPRADVCKEDHKSVKTLWNRSGISDPRSVAVKEQIVEKVVVVKGYSEQVSEVEKPRFHTGENPVFVPATQKPPPPGFDAPRKNYAFDPNERDSTPVPDSLPATPVDSPKRRK